MKTNFGTSGPCLLQGLVVGLTDSAAGLGPARTRVAVNSALNLNAASNKQGAAAAPQQQQYRYSACHRRSLLGTTGGQAQCAQKCVCAHVFGDSAVRRVRMLGRVRQSAGNKGPDSSLPFGF